MKRIVIIGALIGMVAVAGVCGNEERDFSYELPWYCDRMPNMSRLTDAEIWRYIERGHYAELSDALDVDGDGITDFMDIDVDEFIARRELIIGRNRNIERQRVMILTGTTDTRDDDI